MKRRFLSTREVAAFRKHLILDEKSEATIRKYIRDIIAFMTYAQEREITKELVISYKKQLQDCYATRSINSMLASLNSLFSFLCWHDIKVKTIKFQPKVYYPEEKELTKTEYIRLCRIAESRKNKRLSLILQTICGAGIRVSELRFVTVEAVHQGEITVACKSKIRTIFIVKKLREKLIHYAVEQGITEGMIFVTRTGKSISRTNIWREMKSLCQEARVNPQKVFPHSLRHLFARVFYDMNKDIAKLADILGHSSINTTRIYIISTGIEHRKQMEAMKLIL